MLMSYWKAEKLKNAHTVSAKLFWLIPLISISIASLLSAMDAEYYQLNQYNWWYTLFLPMLIILIAGFTQQREKKLKNRAVSSLSVDWKKMWAVKNLYMIRALLYSSFIIYFAQEIISRIFAAGEVRVVTSVSGFIAVLLCIVLNLWQIPLWLFISEKLGFIPGLLLSLACNMVLGVVAAVEKWWIWIPFSYTGRIMCPVLKILPNGLPAVPESTTFSEWLLDKSAIGAGTGVSLILFAFICVFTAKWYEKRGVRGWEN
jgi:lantibiotic protection ABC transporter MutE/EpiE family permease subunit